MRKKHSNDCFLLLFLLRTSRGWCLWGTSSGLTPSPWSCWPTPWTTGLKASWRRSSCGTRLAGDAESPGGHDPLYSVLWFVSFLGLLRRSGGLARVAASDLIRPTKRRLDLLHFRPTFLYEVGLKRSSGEPSGLLGGFAPLHDILAGTSKFCTDFIKTL